MAVEPSDGYESTSVPTAVVESSESPATAVEQDQGESLDRPPVAQRPKASVNPQDIVEDLFLTDAYMLVEREYLLRVAKGIHRLAVAELDKNEETLFMLFSRTDENMDGTINREELKTLLAEVDSTESSVDDALKAMDTNQDGVVSFIELLKWWMGDVDAPKVEASYTFAAKSQVIGALGSGYMGSDEKLQSLPLDSLKQNIVGYKRILIEISDFKVQKKLSELAKTEKLEGMNAEMLVKYHELLTVEFDGDMSLLFDLFLEVDLSGNLQLEKDEMEKLLRLLDTSATDEDIETYMAELQLEEDSMTFGMFISWWDYNFVEGNGHLAEKGAMLMASIKARSMTSSLSAWMPGESKLKASWREHEELDPGKLGILKNSFKQALLEVRRFKMLRNCKGAEREAVL